MHSNLPPEQGMEREKGPRWPMIQQSKKTNFLFRNQVSKSMRKLDCLKIILSDTSTWKMQMMIRNMKSKNERSSLCREMTWSFKIMLFVCLFCVQRESKEYLVSIDANLCFVWLNTLLTRHTQVQRESLRSTLWALMLIYVSNTNLFVSRDSLRSTSQALELIYISFVWMFVNKTSSESRDTSH